MIMNNKYENLILSEEHCQYCGISQKMFERTKETNFRWQSYSAGKNTCGNCLEAQINDL